MLLGAFLEWLFFAGKNNAWRGIDDMSITFIILKILVDFARFLFICQDRFRVKGLRLEISSHVLCFSCDNMVLTFDTKPQISKRLVAPVDAVAKVCMRILNPQR